MGRGDGRGATRLARAGFDAVASTAARLHDRTGVGGSPGSGVLVYHAIGDADGLFGTVSRRRFRTDVARLSDRFEFVALSDLAASDEAGRLALTVDDGMRSAYTEVLPVVREFDVPVTLFLNPGFLGGRDRATVARRHGTATAADRLLTESEVAELAAEPLVSLGNHSLTHADLAAVEDPDAIHREVATARERLEDRFGVEVTAFSYPYGTATDRARRLVRETHDVSVTTSHRTLHPSTDGHDLPRLHAHVPRRRLLWELTPLGDALNAVRYPHQ